MTENHRIFCDQGEDPMTLYEECVEHLKNGRGDKVVSRLMALVMERSAFRNAIMHLQAYIRRQQVEVEGIYAEHAAARERIVELEAALDDARRVRDVPPELAVPSDTPAPPEASKPLRYTSYEQEQEHSAGFQFSSKRVFVDADTGLEWFFPFGADGERSVTFKEALQVVEAVAMRGWQIPTRDELLYLCKRPGERGSAAMFSGMTWDTIFWSATPSVDGGDYVVVVRPVEGRQSERHQTHFVGLALVRSVRSHEQAVIDTPVPPDRRPTSRPRFIVYHARQEKSDEEPRFDSDMIVYDATTGLEWFRPYPTVCSCSGATELVGRLFHNRWRLPYESELKTISRQSIEPNIPSDGTLPEWIVIGPWFWSSMFSAFDLHTGQADVGAQMAHVILVRYYDYTRTQPAGETEPQTGAPEGGVMG